MLVFRFGKFILPINFVDGSRLVGSEIRTKASPQPLAPIVMKISSILIIFLTFCLKSFGQREVGLKCNIGASRVLAWNSWKIQPQKFPIIASGQFGFFYLKTIKSRSILGVELLLTQIEGKEKYRYKDGETFVTYRDYSYLGIPIYYGYKINKANINLGFQFNYLVRGIERIRGNGIDLQGIPYSYEINGILPNIKRYDFGLRVGGNYYLNNRLELGTNFYFGLSNIWKDPKIHPGNWKVRQLTIGLMYKFSKWRN